MSITADALADSAAVTRALRALGANPQARERILAALRDAEPFLATPGVNTREAVIGPIVDALHVPGERIAVELASGVQFSTRYSSQIARDLVLREDAKPDHIFEPQTTKTLLALARTAHHVIVGGAYSGDHVILIAAAIAASGGVVHGFEPNADQQAMLRENIATNHLTNVRPLALGLWDDASVRLTFVGPDALASTEPAADGSIETTTIDAYCAANGIDAGLIMLDIEGSEYRALLGAKHQLEANGPAIVFEIHSTYVGWENGLEQTPIGAYLRELGYTLYGIRDFQSHVAMPGAPVELVPAATAYLEGPPHGFNMLAVKDPSALDPAVFTIVPDVSPKLLHHRERALHYPLAWQDR